MTSTIKAQVAFPPVKLDNILPQVLAKNGLTQLRIAETEKYAHVTFFFTGGVEKPCCRARTAASSRRRRSRPTTSSPR